MNLFETQEIVIIIAAIDSKIEDIDKELLELEEMKDNEFEVIDLIEYWNNERKEIRKIRKKLISLT